MRTTTTTLLTASISTWIWASLLGGCLWSDFDDLSKQAWVNSTTKPDIKATDWGLALQRSARSGDGGRLVVLGAGTATYSELVYGADGESSFPATSVPLQVPYGIFNIGQQPLLLADPASDATALVVASDNGIAIVNGAQGMLKAYQLFGVTMPDAATYMQAMGQPMPQPLVAVGNTVYGAVLPALPNNAPQPTCKLIDSAAPTTNLQFRALGVIREGANDDVLAWETGGKLYRYPSSVFGGCTTPTAQTAVIDTGFMPDQGSQILTSEGQNVVLQGHRGDAGYLRVFRSSTPLTIAAVGEAVMVPKMRTAAILEVAGTRYVIAGVPTALVNGKTAGQVMLYRIGASGLDTLPVATLNDAQPDNNESFGRAVAAMPFRTGQVIAVGADNEVFVYFRANLTNGTPLYGETRQGR